ncbi:MAG: DUF2974 domain-containing protein [Treponema sp.]|nr:DUF2974 domain-containing protein [Treponema sp.]
MFDYISWRGDIDFNASPFNPVDNIILSQLSYLTLEGIVPKPEDESGISIDLAVRVYNEKLSNPNFVLTSMFKEDPDLIRALGSSRRFGNCQLFGYVNHVDIEKETQFSALCIYTDDGYGYIVFRGTDMSIVGWKEDFNMCFKDVVPAQLEAVEYLERMAPMIDGPLRIGGHSKGGNLAIYAASQCSRKTQKRITDVYSNDAPGFNEKVINSEGFKLIKDRIHSYVPQSSVVGMFLEHDYDSAVIKSSESGLMQHNLYSWEVTRNDLVYADKSTTGSRFVNDTIREWMKNIDNDQREKFIEALYLIINAADIKSVSDIENSWFSTAGRVLKSMNNIDESTKKIVRKTIQDLFTAAQNNFDTLLKKDNRS